MKYIGNWKVSQYDENVLNELKNAGYSPLLSALLSSRGFMSPAEASAFLRDDLELLSDPFLLTDMDKAVERIETAIQNNERVAVFGDYDVDGITSTCIVTNYLQKKGLYCEAYIPERLTEGYGISEDALRSIKEHRVSLIITVDCGITAAPQIELARQMGIDTVITDHHECPEELPAAAAVVNPHRKDCNYPFKGLAGVGVAFKLVCALAGAQNIAAVVEEYGDLAAIGTIADIMPVTGENRVIIRRGIEVLQRGKRLGLRKLMEETGIVPHSINSVDISFTLIPKLNAAGRMGKVEVSFKLLMSEYEKDASALAGELCMLNHERRQIENRIYTEAVSILENCEVECPIVLASEEWHHGVSGIVASRLADRYGVPAVIICIEGEEGRGSCRSFGGICIFDALEASKETLSSYGGHAHAAGLTVKKENIAALKKSLRDYFKEHEYQSEKSLKIDYEVSDVSMLSMEGVGSLVFMSPWGNQNPPPLLCITDAFLESVTPIGGDKHLKLKIVKSNKQLECVFFSVTSKEFGLKAGSSVDLAFEPVVNEFRGNRTVQLILREARSSKRRGMKETELCESFFSGDDLSRSEKLRLLPKRNEFASVWRYISANPDKLSGERASLFEDIARETGTSRARAYICLRVFGELGLITFYENGKIVKIQISPKKQKVDLNNSGILSALKGS